MPSTRMVALASAGVVVFIALAIWRQQRQSSSSSRGAEPKVHAHEAEQVKRDLAHLKELGEKIRSTFAWKIKAILVEDGAPIPKGAKKVHMIRHGQGHHNVAQAEWKGANKPGEPYWVSNDPEFRYRDAELTAKGEQQARDLRPRTRKLSPELMVVSPMRRATQTGLLAFSEHVEKGSLPVIAHESAHEIGGKHTCDQRLGLTELKRTFSAVDYSFVKDEVDPLWLDGNTRETMEHLAGRGAELMEFLRSRNESHIVVAAHSAFLATLLNAVLIVTGNSEAASWFGTGEMRTFIITWEKQ